MPQIAIVTDSVACLPRELIEQYGIEIIPLTILIDGRIYRDWVDITPEQAYQFFLENPDSFKTAPATPEECLAVFKKASQKAQNIICVTLSVKISTLYNMANMAREKATTELPGVNIVLIDSGTATAAQGFVALAAARAAIQGKTVDEAVEAALEVKRKVNTIVLLDTVRHVYRSGRVPRIAAQAASILNIKPIFTVAETVHFATAVATRKQGIERMLRMMRDKVENRSVHCAVMHAYDLPGALMLKERVEREFNCVELWISEFSPLMGYATGTGTLGVAFYPE